MSKFYKGIGWEKVLAVEISGQTVFRGAKLYLNPMSRIKDGMLYLGMNVDGQEPVGEADDPAGAAALLLFGFVKTPR